MNTELPALPDLEQRRLIREKLSVSMFVEAAAGTGKTTCLVDRMVSLLAAGKCDVDNLAVLTFTRKAAAQLRTRFFKALGRALEDASGPRKTRLLRASRNIDQAFVGTIHSFCARLLREHPVQSGMPLDFDEMSEEQSNSMRDRAWDEYMTVLFTRGDPIIKELSSLGVIPGDLRSSFHLMSKYPDVTSWETVEVDEPDLEQVLKDLDQYVKQLERVLDSFSPVTGNDKFLDACLAICRHARCLDRNDRADIIALLERFEPKYKPVLKNWPDVESARRQEKRRAAFRDQVALPVLDAWREYCYPVIIRVLLPALDYYRALKESEGRADFGDLLMKAAYLLREGGAALRGRLKRRYSHLLVDEFQDTDPIQAELMMLLTGDDDDVSDWRLSRCRPGALFVVGDPKQSIYRFRRADIVTYNMVRDLVVKSGGQVLTLSSNFRSDPCLVEWVNDVFWQRFPAERTRYCPAYVPLRLGRHRGGDGGFRGLYRLVIPDDYSSSDEAVRYEADFIARTIRRALDGGWAGKDTSAVSSPGTGSRLRPGDFMIVTKDTGDLAVYTRGLEELGIPSRLVGPLPEACTGLVLLGRLLRSLSRPGDPLSLLAVLRSAVFGFSDTELYEFARSGGVFDFRATVPHRLEEKCREAFSGAFKRLCRYFEWFERLPAASALEKTVDDLGLLLSLFPDRASGGEGEPGIMSAAIDCLRSAGGWSLSLSEMRAALDRMIDGQQEIPLHADDEDVVTVLNVHKAKGLEASVVFLACPRGTWHTGALVHVDRSLEKVRGLLAIEARTGAYHHRLTALPPGWREARAEEERFAAAENLRIQYVAATRAGSALVVSHKSSRNFTNPWNVFDAYLMTAPSLPDPGPVAALPVEATSVDTAELKAARSGRRLALERVVAPTYRITAAKDGVHFEAPVDTETKRSELGRIFGTVVHEALEAAVRNIEKPGQRQPDEFAEGLLGLVPSAGLLPDDLLRDVIDTVSATLASPFWKRVVAADKRLFEVPFEMPDPRFGGMKFIRRIMQSKRAGRTTAATAAPLPILRGVIDLVFKESDGWVIVDWKTDRVSPDRSGELMVKYAPQLAAYRDAWMTAVSEPVVELGLFLTSVRTYMGQRTLIL